MLKDNTSHGHVTTKQPEDARNCEEYLFSFDAHSLHAREREREREKMCSELSRICSEFALLPECSEFACLFRICSEFVQNSSEFVENLAADFRTCDAEVKN